MRNECKSIFICPVEATILEEMCKWGNGSWNWMKCL